MTERRNNYLSEWRAAKSVSAGELARRSGVPVAVIEALENESADYVGAQLQALGAALGCEAWRLISGPPASPAASDQFKKRLVAQMLRDICVEAVTTFDDMERLDDLKKNLDAEEFWSAVATLLIQQMELISRTASSPASFALSEK